MSQQMQHFKYSLVILEATSSANVASGAHLEGGANITPPSNAQNLKVTSEIRYVIEGSSSTVHLQAIFNNVVIVDKKWLWPTGTLPGVDETVTLDTTNLFRSGANLAIVNMASTDIGGVSIRANWTLVVEYDAPVGTPPPDVKPIPSPLDFSSIMNQLFMFMFIMMIFSTLPTMMTGLARAAPKAVPTVVKIIKRVRRRPKEEVEEEVEEEE